MYQMEPISIVDVPTDVLAQIYLECDYLSSIVLSYVCSVFRDVAIATCETPSTASSCNCVNCRHGLITWPLTGPEPYDSAAHPECVKLPPNASYVCERAAELNYLGLLKWAVSVGYHPYDSGEICDWAASNGNIPMLEWAVENGYEWTQRTVIWAVRENRADAFMWLVANSGHGIDMDFDIVEPAVVNGNLTALRYAHAVGYQFGKQYDWPFDMRACTRECWEIMLKMGFAIWNILHRIMRENRISDLIWFHDKYPANIDKAICANRNIAWYCQYPTSADVLNWILDQNYPGVMGGVLCNARTNHLEFVIDLINARIATGNVPAEALVVRGIRTAARTSDYTWI